MLCLPAGEADNEETDNSADEQARQQQRQRQQRPQQQQQRSQPQQRPQQQQQRSQPQQRPQQQPTPQQAQQPGPSGHLPPTPGLAQFWAAARGAKVPADLVRLWFARNLGLTTTKDATPEQLVSARDWAMSVGAMTTTLFDITAQLGMEPNGVLDIAHQMFPTPPNAGFLQLGELTQKEFNELLGWARAKLEATVAQQQAEAPPTSDAAPPATPTGDDDIPF
jgi:DNA mismatch repair ATPase MutL